MVKCLMFEGCADLSREQVIFFISPTVKLLTLSWTDRIEPC